LKWPSSAEELRDLSGLMLKYRERHYWELVIGFCTAYVFLQTFAIPGAIFLSILAGPLFGVGPGLIIVSLVATTGASMCYTLSFYLGRPLVRRCFAAMLDKFHQKIQPHRHNLIFYLLFLRVSPLLPNWFINIASPVIEIPLTTFILATFFGLIPMNYLHVTTGSTLSQLQSLQDATVNKKALLTLLLVAFLALIPTLFRNKFTELDQTISRRSSVDATTTSPRIRVPNGVHKRSEHVLAST